MAKISKRVFADGVITHTNPHLISARNSWERKEEAMREILFRGKRVDNKEWVYGDLIHTRGGHPLICARHDFGSAVDGVEVDYNTLCQYTGMIDKNGNKIFEDDILENHHLSEDVARHKVKFEVGMGCYVAILLIGPLAGFFFPFGQSWIENYDKVIVGNIHDNPDLLKGGAK